MPRMKNHISYANINVQLTILVSFGTAATVFW